jgi:hypothetical protein
LLPANSYAASPRPRSPSRGRVVLARACASGCRIALDDGRRELDAALGADRRGGLIDRVDPGSLALTLAERGDDAGELPTGRARRLRARAMCTGRGWQRLVERATTPPLVAMCHRHDEAEPRLGRYGAVADPYRSRTVLTRGCSTARSAHVRRHRSSRSSAQRSRAARRNSDNARLCRAVAGWTDDRHSPHCRSQK